MTQEIKQWAREELMEQLADIEHKRWASWQAYFHSKLTPHTITSLNSRTVMWEDIKTGNYILHKEWVERWNKQIETPYAELSEKEKQSDRDQVEKYWHLIDSLIDKTVQMTEKRIVGIITEFLKDELGYKGKYIETDLSKKNHGTCCYCADCGHFNDECVCENNRIHKFIQSLITNKSDINKDKEI